MTTLGRPPKFETPELMQEVIEQYFTECSSRDKPPTVAGLAYSLNLSRQGLLEYQAKDGFSDTIKRAKQRVEISLEERLDSASPTGAIFNLKNNFGWKDQKDVSADINITKKAEDLTDDELAALAAGSS